MRRSLSAPEMIIRRPCPVIPPPSSQPQCIKNSFVLPINSSTASNSSPSNRFSATEAVRHFTRPRSFVSCHPTNSKYTIHDSDIDSSPSLPFPIYFRDDRPAFQGPDTGLIHLGYVPQNMGICPFPLASSCPRRPLRGIRDPITRTFSAIRPTARDQTSHHIIRF